MNKTKTIAALLPPSFRAWLAIALLGIVSSFEAIKVLHVDHHHDSTETAICTESEEADACHRSIVHFDEAAGCEHPQHFERLVASCEICDALITNYLFEVSAVDGLQTEFEEIIQNDSPLEKTYSTSIAFPALRGPPVLS